MHFVMDAPKNQKTDDFSRFGGARNGDLLALLVCIGLRRYSRLLKYPDRRIIQFQLALKDSSRPGGRVRRRFDGQYRVEIVGARLAGEHKFLCAGRRSPQRKSRSQMPTHVLANPVNSSMRFHSGTIPVFFRLENRRISSGLTPKSWASANLLR